MSVFPDEFREETKECLEKWRNIIINKHETEENFYGDPILLIEYNNDAGLTAKNIDSHAVAQADEKETEPSLFSPSDDNDSDVRITRENNNPFIGQTRENLTKYK
ncbi:hypothetical protein C1646_820863 [Rhizophagus diaphanus]|nr:hypothetical protein C1646_820863 [Rhizophagus diaphanus] [Rhizophagus sp. MUCL 43196]